MVFGNIHYKAPCTQLDARLRECIDYAHAHTLSEYQPGSYPIDGEDLFVNIATYTTTTPENRIWEAHKAYLDLHLMLVGSEQINLNLIDNMELRPYVEKEDFLPADGAVKASLVMEAGDYLVCYPEDVHMTGIADGEPAEIRKAIFKIKL